MMKILNVSSTIDPVTGGGEAERSFQMSKFLAQSGADCRVLTVDTGLTAGRKGLVLTDSTPALFEKHMEEAVNSVRARDDEHRIVFLKSWNE